MKFASVLFLSFAPCTPAPPGKSTIAAAHPMESMAFLLKHLPVAVAEDNGTGNYGHGAKQGRTQVVKHTSYTAPNCQLYSTSGLESSATTSSYKSVTPASVDQSKSVGKDCTYKSGQAQGTEMWKVFANNEVQCCNACIATKGCAAATFQVSSNDHSGGQGPQSWEGFGIHLPDVVAAKTTGGLSVDELMEKYTSRFGDFSKFDAFMDYSVTFFTYDLEHYVENFKADGIKHFIGKWNDGSKRTWYSVIFQVPQSTYMIELVSFVDPSDSTSFPEMEQRMSDAHCDKYIKHIDTPAKYLYISSINRAASDMASIENAYSTLMKAATTHKFDGDAVSRRCYDWSGLDEDVCFTSRTSEPEQDAIFSVKDHEAMLWAVHAEEIGSNPQSTKDKYTDSHFALPISSTGLSALAKHFKSNDPYPITKDTRLAYACEQNYIIDPTGFSIQPLGRASWPSCSWQVTV